MSIFNKVLQKAKKVIDSNFIEPSRRVKRNNAKADALNKARAKSGKFNTGEESAVSQSY